MSIYVPDEMKSEIDGIGDRVNWSNAAQAAFAREIQRVKWPEEPNMEQVLERLRASKASFEERQKTESLKDGREWAVKRANYDDLRRIGGLEVNDGVEIAAWQKFDEALGRNTGGTRDLEESFWWDRDGFTAPSDEYSRRLLRAPRRFGTK